MKGIIGLVVVFLAVVFFSTDSSANEIALGEKRAIKDEGTILFIEYREMKDKFCHLQIEYLKDGKVLLSDHVVFYAYERELDIPVDGKKLTLFHTEISGGTVTAQLNGKEIEWP